MAPLIIPSQRSTRSTRVELVYSDRTLKMHDKILRSLCSAVSERFQDRVEQRQLNLLQEGAWLLNDLCSGFIDSVVQQSMHFCGYCGKILEDEKVTKHQNRRHPGRQRNVAVFLSETYTTEKDTKFSALRHTLNNPVTEDQLTLEYRDFKKMFEDAVGVLNKQKIPVTLLSAVKFLYSTAEYRLNMPANMKQLILRLVCVQGSEAICESWGSIMEKYHSRFTSADLDDKQVQVEMFVNLCGPALGECIPFLKKCLCVHNKKFILHENAKYFTQGKVIAAQLKKKSRFPFHRYL